MANKNENNSADQTSFSITFLSLFRKIWQMGRRKAEKSADFSKIRDAEGRIVTEPRFLEISLCAMNDSTRLSERTLTEPAGETDSLSPTSET